MPGRPSITREKETEQEAEGKEGQLKNYQGVARVQQTLKILSTSSQRTLVHT